MEGFLLEHGSHAGSQGLERRGRQHAELELAVSVNKHRVAEEVQPVRHGSVERTEESVAVLRIALEELLSLSSSLLAEVGHEEVRHLPSVALFFGHDSSGSVAVVVGGCGGEQVALLLHGGEFGVALHGDHADQCVSHALVRHLQRAFPLASSLVIAKFNGVAGALPIELDGEVKIAHPFTVVADVVLPGFEVLNPVVPGLR